MTRYLFCFGYESPADWQTNRRDGGDVESSNAVWIDAQSRDVAMAAGTDFAQRFVGDLFRNAGEHDYPGWRDVGYACWIEDEPLARWSGLALETLPRIRAGDDADRSLRKPAGAGSALSVDGASQTEHHRAMSNSEVRKLLDQLRTEIRKGGLDDETRSMVRQLDTDIHALLEADGDAEADPIVERAREIEADFASEHPTTAGILREVIAALARMGI